MPRPLRARKDGPCEAPLKVPRRTFVLLYLLPYPYLNLLPYLNQRQQRSLRPRPLFHGKHHPTQNEEPALQTIGSLTKQIASTLDNSDGTTSASPPKASPSETGPNPAGTASSSIGTPLGAPGSCVATRNSREESQRLPTARPPAAPQWLLQWATNWLEDRISSSHATGASPGSTTERDQLSRVLPSLESSARPATPQEFLVAMETLFAWAQTFGLDPDVKAATEFYRTSLGDIPADLLTLAIKRSIAMHPYHNLPKPADVRKQVAEEAGRRRKLLTQARASLATQSTPTSSRPSFSERLEKMREQSRNWPDPTTRKRAPINPIRVPGGPGSRAAAEAMRTEPPVPSENDYGSE